MAANPMTKSKIVAALAEKVGVTKKQSAMYLDELAKLAYKESKNGFTFPGVGKLVVRHYKASVLARTAYTFRSFNHNFVLGLAQSFKGADGKIKQDVIGRSLAYLMILAGAAGIPWLDDLLDQLERQTGEDYRNQIRKFKRYWR